MPKVLVDSNGRYVGTMWGTFEPVNGMSSVDVDDEFAESINHLWHLVDGQWVKDEPPAPEPGPEGSVTVIGPA